MTRAEALDQAEVMVDRLFPRVNARGYSESALTPSARITEILRVAEFLLGGDDA